MKRFLRQNQRIFRASAPLLFLLLLLFAQLALPKTSSAPPVSVATSTVLMTTATASPTAVPPTSSPTPTATASPSPTTTLPPDAEIRLLGPPEAAIFRATDAIAFYWQWPLSLGEGQFFQVVLLTPNGVQTLGAVTEPNLGSQFTLQMSDADLDTAVATAQWQVQLSSSDGGILRRSELREIRFLGP